MSIHLTPPEWLTDYVTLWADRLRISQEWRIEIKLALCVGGDEACFGEAHRKPRLNEAVLTFRADIEDNREGRLTIIHELLHVKHSRIDAVVHVVIVDEMVRSTFETTARAAYCEPMESYIESMANVLYDLADKPA